MHMKTAHVADSGTSITGSTKAHIASRLRKASLYAGQLVDLLQDRTGSGATTADVLEARAYYVSLLGTVHFEKQNWEDCLQEYSEARLIYISLARSKVSQREDVFNDLLSSTIDPSLRYAAYQNKVPRTTSYETIVARYVSRKDNPYVDEVLKLNPDGLQDAAITPKTHTGESENIPKIIHWRTKTVNLEDAATAQALARVSAAEAKLSSFLSSNKDTLRQAKAAAYDNILIPSQDAVDATKTAIDELTAEGIPQGDRRMQALQITRTAVNYALVGWRIGRNRILCGEEDGALFDEEITKRAKKPPDNVDTETTDQESMGHKLKRLRERVVLYDATLQSLDSIKELAGVAADHAFVDELEAKKAYFSALRCLAIARSHAFLQHHENALALYWRALDLSLKAPKRNSDTQPSEGSPPNLIITNGQVKLLHELLKSLVSQYRGLVELYNIANASAKADNSFQPPLIECLDVYPKEAVDLKNLVTYPPKIEPIPVKPIFLDVAYNYIDYPGRTRKATDKAVNGVVDSLSKDKEEKRQEGKKGWFGFGR